MPLPKPRKGEHHDEFMSRCHGMMADEFEDPAQRNAVCQAQWDTAKKGGQQPSGGSMKTLVRLVVPFEIKAAADPSAPHTFEGLAAVWTQDLGNDIIHKGAFTKTISNWKASPDALPLLNSHDHFNILSALGQAVDLKETKDGLWSKWEVIDGPTGDEVMRRLKPSPTTKKPIVGKMSIGFEPTKFDFEQPEGTTGFFDRIRHVREANLMEVSLVLFPMAPGATIDASTVKMLRAAARETDPRTLSPEVRLEIRRLNSSLGTLLKKRATPAARKDDEDVSPEDIEEFLEEEENETRPKEKEPTQKPTQDPSQESAGDDSEQGKSEEEEEPGEEGKSKDSNKDGGIYLYSEALQQQVRARLLQFKTSAVGRES